MTKSILLALATLLLALAPASAQWTPDTTLVLKGRVVSMHSKRIYRKAVVVRGGKIVAIQRTTAPVPADAIVIETEGYIYPGLINLHSHPLYNFLRLYEVPRHTTNSLQWPSGKDYERDVNNPAVVLTGAGHLRLEDEALKYAEVKAIVGGETAIQGVPDNVAVKSTLVRNVEGENFGRDEIGARTLVLSARMWRAIETVRPQVRAHTAWFFHLSEGIDERARRQWTFPSFDPDKTFSTAKSRFNVPGLVQAELVWPGLVGIHCTGMEPSDYLDWAQISSAAPKVVWSPLSNLLLYGKTTDVRALRQAGATIGLGTDWSPSGTKNLLWELKVVDRLNKQSSPRIFRYDREIVELVTSNAAKILGWENEVGQIREGFHADLLVLDRIDRSGYRNLIEAREEHVQLVLVGGEPLYGDEAHLAQLKVYGGQPRYEVLPDSPAGRVKAIDMRQDPSARKGDMSLAEVKQALLEGLKFDPQQLADVVNRGVPETSTRNSYSGRDAIRAWVTRYLTRKGLPLSPSLQDEDGDLSADDVRLYLEEKYPHLRSIAKLDTIFTDDTFLADVQRNLHFQPPYSLELDLRRYVPADDGTGLFNGLSDAVSGTTND
ncbi:MAG TPA: hypothetical protein DEA08_21185 [Planctomycetes bacterium]|nr:hypothetical protein [Planctomycetota bacterium]